MVFEAGSIAPALAPPPELMGLSLYSLEKEIIFQAGISSQCFRTNPTRPRLPWLLCKVLLGMAQHCCWFGML